MRRIYPTVRKQPLYIILLHTLRKINQVVQFWRVLFGFILLVFVLAYLIDKVIRMMRGRPREEALLPGGDLSVTEISLAETKIGIGRQLLYRASDVGDDDDPFDPRESGSGGDIAGREMTPPTVDEVIPPTVLPPSDKGLSLIKEMAPDIVPESEVSRASCSPVMKPQPEGKIELLDGDVTQITNSMLQFASAEGLDDHGEYDRLQVWVAYVGAGVPPPSAVNRRPLTKWEREGERFIPDADNAGDVREVGSGYRTFERRGDGAGSQGRSDRPRPSKNLGLRAEAMAQRIKADPLTLSKV